MSKLIKGSLAEGGTVVEDGARIVTTEEELGTALAHQSAAAVVVVPLALWRANRDRLLAAAGSKTSPARLGILLEPVDEPADIAADVERFEVIAVEFPKFADGRGFSIGRLLRERYGYRGELRAIGEVLRDQMFYMLRCGFDAFQLPDSKSSDRDVETALTAYEDFSIRYQTAADEKLPLFRRRMVA